MICAVVPVKPLGSAKQRLADLLSGAERQGLMAAMLEDVLGVLCNHPAIDRTLVVSDDDTVARIARAHRAEVRSEAALGLGVSGLNAVVESVAHDLHNNGVETMMVVPGDLPLLSSDALYGLLRCHAGSAGDRVTISPDSAETGSNVVLCSPPGAMAWTYGPDSFQRHLQIAADLGIRAQCFRNDELARDIDRPSDLLALMGTGASAYHSRRFLEQSGIRARLATLPGYKEAAL